MNYETASIDGVLTHLGQRLEQLRLSKNISQAQLAKQAGVSRRTIVRMEQGETVSLDTLVRVLRALSAMSGLENLVPDPTVRPLERVRMKGRERKRARARKASPSQPWSWGDENL